jgi:signal transduction histidine kinase
LSRLSKCWLGTIAALTAAFIVSAVTVSRSFGLVVFSDVIQCLFLLSGAVAFVPLALKSHGRTRLFWALISTGIALWLSYQLFWSYTEIALRQDVPDLCAWDVVLFLHLVPLMAAIALRPHVSRDEYAARVGRLDFALLVIWWLYVYMLIVMPWLYVVADVAAYNRNLNSVYNAEKLVFLAALLASMVISKGIWRKLYGVLFAVNFCYAASSTLANWAIARNVYYSGSLYDVPLVVAMASLTWIGLRTNVERPEPDTPQTSSAYGVWIARSGMIAVFSLPLFAAWAVSDSHVGSNIRAFRVGLTLLAALSLGVMVFVRQQLLDRELVRLLTHSRDSFHNLKRLQAQILQSEKLASIGQLVGGAAHELNNPITAMLGYSDLLLSTTLSEEQRRLAAKIGQYVRRTKSLVASLISFARQVPAAKTPLDLNTLARTAVKLTQPQWETLKVEVNTQLDPALPKVLGDSNQLLQVCLQLLANCLHLMADREGRVVTISTGRRAGICVLQIATEPMNNAPAPDSDDEDGLALSACQGIVQEHQGHVSREPRADGALLLTVELPAAQSSPTKPKEATVPVLWQSRPYA